MFQRIYLSLLISLLLLRSNLGQNIVNIINPVRFPYGGPFVGIILAIAIPLELPNYEIFFSYNMEGNYNLPQNETDYTWPPDVSRKGANHFLENFLSRKFVYGVIERKLKSHGYPGKNCLLRAICEASEYSMEHTGVLADVFHILLSPSKSKSELGLTDYEKAEFYGLENKLCDKYAKKCEISLLGIISTFEHLF
ncbi:uncharacterized protein [Onthophagus taurus]|uniref:uncharacterized protein n=1 Tax=Onthophagus taurus TaxID=166361 RepID=UPI000C20D22C|nr:uncharacterized protein LOC111419079 [Onthophagus taurus]